MRYLILIVLAVVSCKTTSKNSQLQSDESIQQVFMEIGRELTDKYVIIKLKNSSDQSQIILDPMKKSIERNVDGKWTKVSVLYCDCGGPPCPAPPNERPIEAGGVFSFRWDLIVEECKSDENGRTTIKEQASEGLYRATYRFKSQNGDTQQMTVSFSL